MLIISAKDPLIFNADPDPGSTLEKTPGYFFYNLMIFF